MIRVAARPKSPCRREAVDRRVAKAVAASARDCRNLNCSAWGEGDAERSRAANFLFLKIRISVTLFFDVPAAAPYPRPDVDKETAKRYAV